MKTYIRRHQIFRLAKGTSECLKNHRYKDISQLPYYFRFDIRVSLPNSHQMSGAHPFLAKRIIDDWKDELIWFACSTGNFHKAIREGRVNLGHVFAEMYSHCLYRILISFSELQKEIFDEFVEVIEENECCTIYRVWIFTSVPLPEEFSSLVELVLGYVNALIENRPFPIHERLKAFIEHRGIEIVEEPVAIT